MSEQRKAWLAVLAMFSFLAVGLILPNGTGKRLLAMLPETGAERQARADAEWERYKVAQSCKFTGNIQTRIVSSSQFSPATRMPVTTSSTITEYEWRCKGGDAHWRQ